MSRDIYFRSILPPFFTIATIVFGEWGLWLRICIINHSSLGWHSTLPFHVWPWPFKFAAIFNIPAFLAGLLLSWSLDAVRPEFPESISFVSVLLFVPMLWYWIGSWLDERRDTGAHKNMRKSGWILLLVFAVVCVITLSIPPDVAGYTSYLPSGILIWIVAAAGITASTISRKCNEKARAYNTF
jgi:hypothetical protein